MNIADTQLFNKITRWYGKRLKDEVRGEMLRTKVKMSLNPGRTRRRHELVRPFLSGAYGEFKRNGFHQMRLPGYTRVAPLFHQIVADHVARDEASFGSKKNLVNLLTPEHVLKHPEIMDVVFDEQLLQAVFNYYGYVPELASLGLFLTPQNDDVEKSQLWHIDSYDPHHLKHISIVEEVTPEKGPFTFLDVPRSNEIRRDVGQFKRGLDFEAAYKDKLAKNIALVGKEGDGMFVDVSQCLHQGGRTRKGRRVLFFIHFATHADYLVVEKNHLTGLFFQHEPEIVSKYATTELRSLMLRSLSSTR